MEGYIAGHRQTAEALRTSANTLTEPQLRAGLATLHEGIAWLAATVRDTSPKHEEYHRVRQAHLYEMAAARFRSAADFAQIATRSALIANGGALIAMLTFLGNSQRTPHGCAIWLSFAFFVGVLLAALLTVLFAYQTQSAYGRQEAAGSDKIYFHLIGDVQIAASEDFEESNLSPCANPVSRRRCFWNGRALSYPSTHSMNEHTHLRRNAFPSKMAGAGGAYKRPSPHRGEGRVGGRAEGTASGAAHCSSCTLPPPCPPPPRAGEARS